MDAGVWEGRVDAATAQEHLRRYIEAGGSSRSAEHECGLRWRTILRIFQHQQIMVDTRDRILGLAIPELPPPRRGCVYAIGSRRRIQGLMMDGWSVRVLAARSMLPLSTTCRIKSQMFVIEEVHDKIAACATALLGQHGPSQRTAAYAAAQEGWVSLDAWGDDIDDPRAVPIVTEDSIDMTLVHQMLDTSYYPRPAPPACYLRHGRYFRSCQECRFWRTAQIEAVRLAMAPQRQGGREMTPPAVADVLGISPATVHLMARGDGQPGPQ